MILAKALPHTLFSGFFFGGGGAQIRCFWFHKSLCLLLRHVETPSCQSPFLQTFYQHRFRLYSEDFVHTFQKILFVHRKGKKAKMNVVTNSNSLITPACYIVNCVKYSIDEGNVRPCHLPFFFVNLFPNSLFYSFLKCVFPLSNFLWLQTTIVVLCLNVCPSICNSVDKIAFNLFLFSGFIVIY